MIVVNPRVYQGVGDKSQLEGTLVSSEEFSALTIRVL